MPAVASIRDALAGADARPGQESVGRERVTEIQRARILSAAVEVARERGAEAMTVARVVSRAGLSRRTFYELFADREDCFLAAFDDALARASAIVLPAYEAEPEWRAQIRAALAALLEFFDDEPGLGALLVVDALRAGPGALERRAQVLRVLIEAVERGATARKASTEHPELTAEGVVGLVFSLIHARMLERAPGGGGEPEARRESRAGRAPASPRRSARTEPLSALLNPLMSMIVLPYLGTSASQRELRRPVAVRPAAPQRRVDPLKDLDMRLTYRTVRVLTAIAAEPRASNREVAKAAGVSDQGQMSKLLNRLHNLGLIENTGAGPVRGEPNAWELTARGRDVEQAIRMSAEPGGQAHETERQPAHV
jgi:AcrR family transcriptional regulator